MKVAILILAAGTSSRMGTPKQLLPIGNKTLLGISIESSLQSSAHKTFCVLGANVNKIRASLSQYEVEIIVNSRYKNGLSSSIVEGVKRVQLEYFDAILIMLADQPLIDASFLEELIALYKQDPIQIVATSYKNNNGVPAIFPRSYFEQLQQLKGDKGAKELLESQSKSINYNPDQLIDIDTIFEYEEFLKTRQ